MTFQLPSPPSFGFASNFAAQIQRELEDATRPAVKTSSPPRVYGPKVTEDRAADLNAQDRFKREPAYEQARKEFAAALQLVMAFAREQTRTSDMAAAIESLEALERRQTRGARLLSPDIKMPLEALAEKIVNPRIAPAHKCSVLEGIRGLDLCPERIRDELYQAVCLIGAHEGGLLREVAAAYVPLVAARLQELLRAEPRMQYQDVTTPHVLNPFLEALELPRLHQADAPQDRFAVDLRLHGDIVKRCAAGLARTLGPLVMADWLADQCLIDLRADLAARLQGETFELMDGDGHIKKLERSVLELSQRYGPLNSCSAFEWNDDGEPCGLARDASLLAVDIRNNMTENKLAQAPAQLTLDDRCVGGWRHRIQLLEGRRCIVLIDLPNGTTRQRPPTIAEAQGLLAEGGRLDGMPIALDERARGPLIDHIVARGTPSIVRRVVASHPTRQGVRAVIDRIISDDDTLAGWMSGTVHRWPAPVLDEALDAMIVNRRGRALGELLREWRGTGFPEAWMRQIRREASWTRALNTDTRVAGRDEDDSLRADLTQSQHALLDRIEHLLGDEVSLPDCRRAARSFAAAHPLGQPRVAIDDKSLDQLAGALLRSLPDNLVQRLAPPVLGEDGGLSGALDAALFALDSRKVNAELALVRRLSDSLSLTPEATGALLQVTSAERFPVPFPLLGAALLMGREQAVAAVFAWTRAMFRDGRLDAREAGRILLPETLWAEHAFSPAPARLLGLALGRFLRELTLATEDGVLSAEHLRAAAGRSGGQPLTLLETAASLSDRAGEEGWQAWRERQAASSLPSTRSSVSSA